MRRAGLVLWCAWILWALAPNQPRLGGPVYQVFEAFDTKQECLNRRAAFYFPGDAAWAQALRCLPDTVRP